MHRFRDRSRSSSPETSYPSRRRSVDAALDPQLGPAVEHESVPGPAITNLGFLRPEALVFVPAMAVGMVVAQRVFRADA